MNLEYELSNSAGVMKHDAGPTRDDQSVPAFWSKGAWKRREVREIAVSPVPPWQSSKHRLTAALRGVCPVSSKIPTWKRTRWYVDESRFRASMAIPGARAPARPSDLIQLDPFDQIPQISDARAATTAQQDYLDRPDAEEEPPTPRSVLFLESVARRHALTTIHMLLQSIEPSAPSENFDKLRNLVGLALWEPD